MDYSKIIDNNTIIICDDDIKKRMLEYLNNSSKLYSVKFMGIGNIVKGLFFDYDVKSINYLMHKYGINYDVALTYIKNMYYVDNINYSSKKLNILVEYKKELEDNKLLIKDDLFIDLIKKNKIVVCMKKITKYDRYIIDLLKQYTDVTIYEFNYPKYEHKVYEFSTIDKEIEYVAYSICDLISKGININDIKIANIDDDYTSSIKRIFGYFNIPINLPNKSYILGTKIGKDFIDNYDSDINKTIEAIDKYKGTDIYNSIIDICNKYCFVDDYFEVKDMIIHDLGNTLVNQKKLKNAIEVVDYKSIFDDEYVFLMNFNLKSIPIIYKDEDYITDNIKPFYLDSTNEKNKMEKVITIKSIDSIKNLVITFKDITPTSECYPSNLVDNYPLVKPQIDIYKSYSSLNDKLKLAASLDELVKYGSKSKELNALKYNYDIPYMAYDNKYVKVDIDDLYKIANNKLSFSYTNIEQYNECSFKYYLNNILKLNIYEENFAAIIGTVFHHILEIGIDKDIDVDMEVTSFLQSNYKDRLFSKKETFFFNNIKENMKFVLKTIKKQMSFCKLDKIKTEERVFISKDKNIKITFTGVVDKLLYREDDDKTIVAIIDYKTGNYIDIDLGYMSYGIGLQLPIYIYLASNMNLKNVKFAGIYLQKIMPDIDKLDFLEKHSREDKLKLEGYSNSDQSIIGEFDITYSDSSVIKGLKTNSNGRFRADAKTLSDEQFDAIRGLASEQIDKCIDNVVEANFDINPIMKENDSVVTACAFCNYKDICFRSNNDIRVIKKDKDLSFLGGEVDGMD